MVSMKTKTEAIGGIEQLIGELVVRFTDEDPAEQEWMHSRCSPAAQRVLAEVSVSNLHLLDEIPVDDGTGTSVNIVGLSHATGIPKGTVSKTMRRLVELGLVARHQLPDNRKEVHLRLTELGAEIRTAHHSLHAEMNSGVPEFLARYSTDELAVVTRVLTDLLRMPREGLRFRPDLLD